MTCMSYTCQVLTQNFTRKVADGMGSLLYIHSSVFYEQMAGVGYPGHHIKLIILCETLHTKLYWHNVA